MSGDRERGRRSSRRSSSTSSLRRKVLLLCLLAARGVYRGGTRACRAEVSRVLPEALQHRGRWGPGAVTDRAPRKARPVRGDGAAGPPLLRPGIQVLEDSVGAGVGHRARGIPDGILNVSDYL